jgi:hypothetical protein
MLLRQFNTDGIERFRKELEKCRRDPLSKIDFQFLEDDIFTEIIPGDILLEYIKFETKGDAGKYLHSILDTALVHDNIMWNVGLWSWLSLFFFDSICPPNSLGHRKVKSDYYYIYDTSSRRYYRHLLFIPWRVLDIAPDHHRLVTTTPVDTGDSITDEVIKNETLRRIPCIFEVLDRIYWDETRQKVRKRVSGPGVRKGDLRNRFVKIIRQLDKTYDLQRLNAVQLIELLGDEFNFPRNKTFVGK